MHVWIENLCELPLTLSIDLKGCFTKLCYSYVGSAIYYTLAAYGWVFSNVCLIDPL